MIVLGSCFVGLVTLHSAMPAVLAAHPERNVDADGHIALLECSRIGERYQLMMNGHSFSVVSSDCASRTKPAKWPTKRAIGGRELPWLGDVDATIWRASGVPMAPAVALLCPL